MKANSTMTLWERDRRDRWIKGGIIVALILGWPIAQWIGWNWL